MEVSKKLNLQNLACKSFNKKILDEYFIVIYIIKAFAIAFCLSAFIYFEYFEITYFGINSLLAIIGFYFLLGENRVVWFWSGFFIGALWFYWISLSFVYYDLAYLIPFIILSIALFYAFLFLLIGKFGKNITIQAVLLYFLSFIEPFGFNWLKLEITLLNSYFSTQEVQFGIFLLGIVALKVLLKWYKIVGIIFLVGALDFSSPKIETPPIDVEIPSMNIAQSQRWDLKYQKEAIKLNFELIENAIEKGKDLIILPESAFPLYLNRSEELIDILKNYSFRIAIVTGSLTYENDNFFNSSYFFQEGEMRIAHKIVLVPFGEEVPLPEFLADFVNRLFFDGAKDYIKAKVPQDFTIKGIPFRSAICFEATKDLLYQNNPKQMIAISNNAWFTPSIEQTLQNLLLRFYAKKYQTIIYHSANSGKSGVILP